VCTRSRVSQQMQDGPRRACVCAERRGGGRGAPGPPTMPALARRPATSSAERPCPPLPASSAAIRPAFAATSSSRRARRAAAAVCTARVWACRAAVRRSSAGALAATARAVVPAGASSRWSRSQRGEGGRLHEGSKGERKTQTHLSAVAQQRPQLRRLNMQVCLALGKPRHGLSQQPSGHPLPLDGRRRGWGKAVIGRAGRASTAALPSLGPRRGEEGGRR